jgi:hypothetical protein
MGRPLVLGQLSDYVTGELIDDTDDERLRQKIGHLLVDELGYQRADLDVGSRFPIRSGPYRAAYQIDFAVTLTERTVLLIRYCPGALVALERPTVALARLLRPYVVPRAVITNGLDARLLDVGSGEVLTTGLAAIPRRQELALLRREHRFSELPFRRREAEARILVAFDALESECDRLPCPADSN